GPTRRPGPRPTPPPRVRRNPLPKPRRPAGPGPRACRREPTDAVRTVARRSGDGRAAPGDAAVARADQLARAQDHLARKLDPGPDPRRGPGRRFPVRARAALEE